jgi:hypothetical protein
MTAAYRALGDSGVRSSVSGTIEGGPGRARWRSCSVYSIAVAHI